MTIRQALRRNALTLVVKHFCWHFRVICGGRRPRTTHSRHTSTSMFSVSCLRQRRQLQLLSVDKKRTSVATLMVQTCLLGGIAFIVNKDWYGRCFVFPLLMRQILSWSPVNYSVDEHGELQELPRTSVEKILVQTCATHEKAFSILRIPYST